MSTEKFDPADALALVQQSRVAVTQRVDAQSWRYDLIYSGLAAAMVAGWALPDPFGALNVGLCGVLLGVLASTWARSTGVFVNGVTPRRARWIALSCGVLIGALMVLGIYLVRESGAEWAPVALAAPAFAVALGASRLWRRAYRLETGGRG